MKITKKYIQLSILLIIAVLFYGCDSDIEGMIDVQENDVEEILVEDESVNKDEFYDESDGYSDWRNENPIYINFTNSLEDINDSGIEVDGHTLTITEAGVYVLSGELENGQIVVNEQNDGDIKLVLNGVKIHNEDSAAIHIVKAGKTIISLEEGTDNIISDGSVYIDEEDEANATIFSKSDLTINGNGNLTVYANYNNGIVSRDNLIITGGNLHIFSADDGLMGRDLVAIYDGIIHIESEDDGIKSTNDNEGKGQIIIAGGTININANGDGIQGAGDLYIIDGEFNIVTGGGSGNSEENTSSTKGIKSNTLIGIDGGVLNVDSLDDAIHSDGDIVINDGEMNLKTGDDGIHADGSIVINGGIIDILESYEGIEGASITITNGEIYIVASDDGINVADGTSDMAEPRRGNQNIPDDLRLIIEGGYIVVNAQGDGIDSNGHIDMTGGVVIVNGPTAHMDSAIDYDGVFEISGGTLIAAGSSGMVEAPSDSSTQNAISVTFSTVQEANTLINVQDSQGHSILTFAPEKNFQNVVISTEALVETESYTVYIGGTVSGEDTNGLYTNESYENGKEYVSFTLSDTITWLSEEGITTGNQQGRMPMEGGGGRMNQREMPEDEAFFNREDFPDREDMPKNQEFENNGGLPMMPREDQNEPMNFNNNRDFE
ncbi:uncharacterized protein DUF4353 [Natranaerovirga hydrolytica]|uniref:Uncharacterized protein DUF4353 n=1 Tax=Natranaerovirga hydrolytica TaxID=680378 RepID=A0A4R1MJL9_9FIRM|nr:carbohydrate-binding domain-containing protein [Natranaerovirga hydrolytica]TCK92697.1 uncharacterized protein DUF4353 [Natranaerovirga hydrolytica]